MNIKAENWIFTHPWKKLTVKEAVIKYSKTKNPIDPDEMGVRDLFEYVKSLDPKTDLEKFTIIF